MLSMYSLDAILEFGNLLSRLKMADFNISIFLFMFVLLTLLENKIPWKKCPDQVSRNSYKSNLGLYLINSIVLSIFSVSALMEIAGHYSTSWFSNHFSPATEMILSFLLFDLSLYFWHRLSHKYEFLWQFHRIHHSDLSMNVSTAFRVHLFDHLTMAITKAVYIALFGFAKEAVLMNEIISTLFLMFHHGNVAFKGEKILGNLIIVPYLHRLHHSTNRQEHDMNYGAVLSIWDRLFGTFSDAEPKKLGIEETIPQDFLGLIRAGFFGETAPSIQEINRHALETMIAEAAYYKAEKRNFSPGNEIKDWLDAKQEIIKQVYGEKSLHSPKKSGSQTAYSKQQICC
ncbi:sterol desaturase family protein [Methyloglobulus sp.]|uniref:sterol desaturase family protein n=1 Tax=Methyloglobulus sp. TaxID=2518622 RepID=UPI0032B85600